MILKNYTPHTINLYDEAGYHLNSWYSEGVARVNVANEVIDSINIITDGGLTIDVPITSREVLKTGVSTYHGLVEGLPSEQPNTYYIVSQLCANVLRNYREDLVFPDRLLRDETGAVLGCTSFAKP